MPKQVDKSTVTPPVKPANVGTGFGTVDLESVGEKVTDETLGMDGAEYMAMLDKMVTGSMYDEEPVGEDPTQAAEVDAGPTRTQPQPQNEAVSDVDELDRVSRAYSESSREAKRLAEENRQLKQYADYIPILDELKRDPDLVQHVNNYLEGNDTTEQIATRLGLPEDFVYDPEEAVLNVKSDSGKVLRGVMHEVVKENLKLERERMRKEIETTRLQDSIRQQREGAAKKYNLSINEIDDLEDWAKGYKLNYDDLYWLKNRDSRDQVISRNAVDEVREQSRKMSRTPKSLAGAGSGTEKPVDVDRELFLNIKKSMEGMQGVFDE